MTKYLLTIALFFTLAAVAPASAATLESDAMEAETTGDGGIKVSVAGKVLRVSGAEGKTMVVVSLTGNEVARVDIDSQTQRVELNLPRGCYLMSFGNVVRRVYIQ